MSDLLPRWDDPEQFPTVIETIREHRKPKRIVILCFECLEKPRLVTAIRCNKCNSEYKRRIAGGKKRHVKV